MVPTRANLAIMEKVVERAASKGLVLRNVFEVSDFARELQEEFKLDWLPGYAYCVSILKELPFVEELVTPPFWKYKRR
jgi:hypothetical protein